MDGRRTGLPRRWLVSGFAVLAACLILAHEAVTRRAYGRALDTLDAIAANAFPSIERLGDIREGLHSLERTLETEHQNGWHRAREAAAIASELAADADAYLGLPKHEHEAIGHERLRVALVEVRAAAGLVLAARSDTERAAAVEERLAPAISGAIEIVDGLVNVNAHAGAAAALEIVRAHARANTLSVTLLLGILATLFALAVAVERSLAESEGAVIARLDELDAFSATVAHDVKGLLAPVRLGVALARKDVGASGSVALAKVEGALARIVSLVDGLLAFARSGAAPEPGARASVEEVLRESVGALAPLAREEQVAVTVADVPRLEVPMSAALLSSVVDNLVRNAIVHMGDATTRIVRVGARRSGASVLIEVDDTGPGIATDVLARLGRPFQRGSTRSGGSGLGLATVKRLVEAHHGRLTIRSAPGRGSTFAVSLPWCAPAAETLRREVAAAGVHS